MINVPGDQPNIAAAVAAASNGDTIIVAAGAYAETVTVSKEVSIIGTNATLAPAADSSGFIITASNVTIQGFTIQVADTADGAPVTMGIQLNNAPNGRIQNNTINTTGQAMGVWVCGSDSGCTTPASNLTVFNNTI
ncbi:right-handed parallel beta-helix repeat-containing protein, partial [Candidatus Woesearchaeota archaeon]|nr:right-handed parallel beta-helix repeat-containing protein [Candidatus Woesearchaeota archaeon]